MSKNRITRLVTAGAIALVGFGAVAAVPVASASAATHAVSHTVEGTGRDSIDRGQRENPRDTTTDKGTDSSGDGRDTGTSSDPGSTGRDGTGDSQSSSIDHMESRA